jgi:hypothetical protein
MALDHPENNLGKMGATNVEMGGKESDLSEETE